MWRTSPATGLSTRREEGSEIANEVVQTYAYSLWRGTRPDTVHCAKDGGDESTVPGGILGARRAYHDGEGGMMWPFRGGPCKHRFIRAEWNFGKDGEILDAQVVCISCRRKMKEYKVNVYIASRMEKS